MTPPESPSLPTAGERSASGLADGERIDDIDVSTEMQGSFLEYAYSVIYARALPDARDGLKPVQRRILFQMSEMGLRPDRGHVKSARVVGDVMGRLHPHGDTAIYDALVRLSQDFTMRVPLIDGHGNFGSLDDGPAAARYTEARLQAAAMAMTDGLDEDVVDFVPNYDNQLTQPEVLPAAYPNLLVNGASGIAVGMATNMAPHNLIEVAAAARHLLENPDATLDDLMAYVPGPDLPTGGTIVGLEGIREAYATGRGSFKTRAKVTVEQLSARRTGLVVTELPYLVGPEKVIEKIKDGVNAKKITGISDVTDLTDRKHGLRLVIGIKTGFSADGVLEQLYRLTPLEDGFSINNVALVDGTPQTLGLRELLRVYLDHRISVVTRRSRYRLTRRQERLHLVLGLLIAILDIDEVIQVIRASDDAAQARTRLIDVFDLSTLQADYILELQLRRLTKFSRIELEAERDKLQAEIAELETLLGDPARVRVRVAEELDEVAERFGTPRRTLLTEAKASIASTPAARKAAAASGPSLEIADVPTIVVLATTGRAVRVDLPEGAEPPVRATRRNKHDAILSSVATTTRGELGAITSRGRLLRFTPVDLPAVPPTRCSWRPGHASRTTWASPTRRNACWAWSHSIPSCRSRSAPRRASSSVSRPAASRRGRTSRSSRSSPVTRSWASPRDRTPSTWCSSPRTRSCCISRHPRCGLRASPPEGWPASTWRRRRPRSSSVPSTPGRMWWSPRSRRPPRRWPGPIRGAPRYPASASSRRRAAPPVGSARTPSSRVRPCSHSPGSAPLPRWRWDPTALCAPSPTRAPNATPRGPRWMPWSARSVAGSNPLRRTRRSDHASTDRCRSTPRGWRNTTTPGPAPRTAPPAEPCR
jgi:DNA gyrase subunit A